MSAEIIARYGHNAPNTPNIVTAASFDQPIIYTDDFIQWLYMRDFGETLTTERLERAYDEYKREIR